MSDRSAEGVHPVLTEERVAERADSLEGCTSRLAEVPLTGGTEEDRRLLERGAQSERFDVVTRENEDAPLAVDLRQPRLRNDHPLEPLKTAHEYLREWIVGRRAASAILNR